jgi:hypothetical protein
LRLRLYRPGWYRLGLRGLCCRRLREGLYRRGGLPWLCGYRLDRWRWLGLGLRPRLNRPGWYRLCSRFRVRQPGRNRPCLRRPYRRLCGNPHWPYRRRLYRYRLNRRRWLGLCLRFRLYRPGWYRLGLCRLFCRRLRGGLYRPG